MIYSRHPAFHQKLKQPISYLIHFIFNGPINGLNTWSVNSDPIVNFHLQDKLQNVIVSIILEVFFYTVGFSALLYLQMNASKSIPKKQLFDMQLFSDVISLYTIFFLVFRSLVSYLAKKKPLDEVKLIFSYCFLKSYKLILRLFVYTKIIKLTDHPFMRGRKPEVLAAMSLVFPFMGLTNMVQVVRQMIDMANSPCRVFYFPSTVCFHLLLHSLQLDCRD